MDKLKRRLRERRQKGLERRVQKSFSLRAGPDSMSIDAVDINGYNVSILDDSMHLPIIFCPDKAFIGEVKRTIHGIADEYARAKALFDWVEGNIRYDHQKPTGTYRTAHEVFILEEGVCGEMAYLYITMARLAGLTAKYVEVDRDFSGKDVHHACAAVYPCQQEVFVDPAYHRFGVRHKAYRILDDREMFRRFLEVRQRDPIAVPLPVQKKKGFLEWLLER